jgi:hypothetical protein
MKTKDMRRPIRLFSGESIPPIIAGLEPQLNDKILCAGKAGDVALALLEYVSSVVAFDPRTEQKQVISLKERYIKGKDYESFLMLDHLFSIFPPAKHGIDLSDGTSASRAFDVRKNYFDVNRFDRIVKKYNSNQGSFGFISDLKSLKNDEVFHKMYLSDFVTDDDLADVRKELDRKSKLLVPGGLMYVSNHAVIATPRKYDTTIVESENLRKTEGGVLNADCFKDKTLEHMLPGSLVLERDLTQRVWGRLGHEKYTPAVYRKVG